MKPNLKYVGLLAILPLLMVSLAPSFLGVADAKKADGSAGYLDTRSYGIANAGVVCGDRLCSQEPTMVAIKEGDTCRYA